MYGNSFFEYTASSSRHSANAITSLVSSKLDVESVLDVGCARGTWLRAWQEQGICDVQGVDGNYVDQERLEIEKERFSPRDISVRFDLGRKFDLVQSLEVAEHIQPDRSEQFVENLVRHTGRYVLFSAAPRGQGGEHHINEQSYEFWRQLFQRSGFDTFDLVRPRIQEDKQISYWYRYNVFLYVRRKAVAALSLESRGTIVRPEERLKDISPPLFQARKAVVRLLPARLQTMIAGAKSRLAPTGRV